MARIDDDEARLDAELKGIAAANDAAVEAARARIGWFKQQYETTAKLHRTGGASEEEVEGRRQQLLAAQHELRNENYKRDQADADHEKSLTILDRHVIASPITGIVRERRRQPYEAVQALETVFHVVRTDRMRIEGEFDQKHLGRLARGMSVEVCPERIVGEIDRVTHSSPITAVRFLPGGQRLAFSTSDGMIVVWNYSEQRREHVIRASPKAIRAITVPGKSSEVLITGDEDGLLKFWNIKTGKELREPIRVSNAASAVTALEADPIEEKTVYVGLANGVIQQWDWNQGVVVKSFAAPGRKSAHINQVTSLSLSKDRGHLLSAADDRAVTVWSTTDDAGLISVVGRDAPPDKEVRQFSFAPSDDVFPLSVFGVLQLRRTSDGLPTIDVERPGGRDPFIWLNVFTPTPGLLVTARESGDLELWRLADGQPPRIARCFTGHDKDRIIRRVDFSSDGALMASCSDDRTLRLWRIPTTAELDSERLPGAVVFVSPQVEPGTNAVKFFVEAANQSGVLTANARATVIARPRQ